ncbi:MAG: hypothetical protein IKA65_05875 [Lentisphaeria bacterium]|nr:hypothetical protein [Lentisphaeria bacterium]
MKKLTLTLFALLLVVGSMDLQGNTSRRRRSQLEDKDKDLCMSHLRSFYGSLKLYSAANNGVMPRKDNYAGLQILLKHGITRNDFICKAYRGKKLREKSTLAEEFSPYIYFGGVNLVQAIKKCPKLLIMADKPGSRHITVLLADGTIERLELKKRDVDITNVQSLVEYLNTIYKYPASELKSLRTKAKAMDRVLYSSKR